jgi:hypothetical protein
VTDPFEESLRIQNEAEQTRLDLIWTDLDVILTLASVAETEYKMDNQEHAAQTLASAEKGYSEMLRYFSLATGLTPEVAGKTEAKFKDVRERLDGLRRFR